MTESPQPSKRVKHEPLNENVKENTTNSPASRKRKKHIVMFTGYDDPQVSIKIGSSTCDLVNSTRQYFLIGVRSNNENYLSASTIHERFGSRNCIGQEPANCTCDGQGSQNRKAFMRTWPRNSNSFKRMGNPEQIS